ncbi:MAG: glycosyltransferase family A protein [Bacteroidota bacterium]
MQRPLVSILIPAYNADRTIARTLSSCMNQTYKQVEIIVVDDASTDYTMEVIKRFSNIKLITHTLNEGIAKSRNNLLREAKGKYVVWLDADDEMMHNRIEKQVMFMEYNPTVDIAGTWIYTDSETLPEKKLPTDPALIKAYLWFKNCIVQPSVISRNFYNEENIFYDPEYDYMEDYELWYRLSKTKVIANIPEHLTIYDLPTLEKISVKHERYEFEKKLNMLWELKWKDVNIDVNDYQKKLFQDFLYKFNRLKGKEVVELRRLLKQIKNNDNKLMIHFYSLLLYVRLGGWDKLKNFDLFLSTVYYPKMKKMYLAQ